MARVSSEELYPVLNEIVEWPTTGDELATKAQDLGASRQVMVFFESIPLDTQFDSEAEVLNMAEQIDDPDMQMGDTGITGTDVLADDSEIY